MTDAAELDKQMDNVGLNDRRVEIQSFDRYKGRKGVTDRNAILSSSLLRARTHYVPKKDKGTTFKCISTKEKQGICCKSLGDADQKFGMVLFQYSTDETGALLAAEKLAGRVKLWIVSESRYTELSNIHKEFPLMDDGFDKPQSDFTAKCTEENFQRMAFTPAKDAHWKKKKEWYDTLKAKEQKARSKALIQAMGRELTELEIMELLEIDSGSARPPTSSAEDIDVSDVLSE